MASSWPRTALTLTLGVGGSGHHRFEEVLSPGPQRTTRPVLSGSSHASSQPLLGRALRTSTMLPVGNSDAVFQMNTLCVITFCKPASKLHSASSLRAFAMCGGSFALALTCKLLMWPQSRRAAACNPAVLGARARASRSDLGSTCSQAFARDPCSHCYAGNVCWKHRAVQFGDGAYVKIGRCGFSV